MVMCETDKRKKRKGEGKNRWRKRGIRGSERKGERERVGEGEEER